MTMTTRYHPLLVALHWLLAVLLLLQFAAGALGLGSMPNSDPDKAMAIGIHMGLGLTIGALMLLRLGTRLAASSPPPAETGNRWLNRLARFNHGLLYFLVFGMVASGLGLAQQAGLFGIAFGDSGRALPPDWSEYPPILGHQLFSRLLLLFVLLHAVAALWHHFGRKDGLLTRMWFGKRDAAAGITAPGRQAPTER